MSRFPELKREDVRVLRDLARTGRAGVSAQLVADDPVFQKFDSLADRIEAQIEDRQSGVLEEIAAERTRQDEKWGEQNHPFQRPRAWWEGGKERRMDANRRCGDAGIIPPGVAKLKCDRQAQRGTITWWDILIEEVSEAVAESNDLPALREELVQVAAVTVAMIERIDRWERQPPPQHKDPGLPTHGGKP